MGRNPLMQEAAAVTIQAVKSILATHGIPEVVVSDNGPQFANAEFGEFAQDVPIHPHDQLTTIPTE